MDDFERRYLYELGRRGPSSELCLRIWVIGLSVVLVLLVVALVLEIVR